MISVFFYYGRSRLALRLNVIERTSLDGEETVACALEACLLEVFVLVLEEDGGPTGVGLCDNDARSSFMDFSRSMRCLLNLPIPGR